MNLLLGYWRLSLLAVCLPFFPAYPTPVLAKDSEVQCENFKMESECETSEHPQSSLWSKATVKSLACEACINVMSVIGNFMESDSEELKDLCGYTGVCDPGKEMPGAASDEVPEPESVEKNLVQEKIGPACELCQYVSTEIDKLLNNNPNMHQNLRQSLGLSEEVINAAKEVCSAIPSYVAGSCQDLVSTHGLSIMHLLLEETDLDSVCTTLNICEGKAPARAVNMATFKSNIFCEVCKMVDGYLDQNLDKNSTQAMILSAFEKACSRLPGVYKEECDLFVKKYEPMLIEALHDEMDPESLCPKIGACPPTPAKPLLGTEHCARGPSYWCENMETAAQCNAVEHCKKHVWS
ncbi:prosaposin [Sarcophilus harrisii]|uniref:Prosaposin n=1 Tax=Sarcophilus harrisii TaxID=9305 RepID=A0A7N4PS83_SARHA|nr:prosaposin [Sarcophilus harrisii]